MSLFQKILYKMPGNAQKFPGKTVKTRQIFPWIQSLELHIYVYYSAHQWRLCWKLFPCRIFQNVSSFCIEFSATTRDYFPECVQFLYSVQCDNTRDSNVWMFSHWTLYNNWTHSGLLCIYVYLFHDNCHGIVHATVHDLRSFTNRDFANSLITDTASDTISGFQHGHLRQDCTKTAIFRANKQKANVIGWWWRQCLSPANQVAPSTNKLA